MLTARGDMREWSAVEEFSRRSQALLVRSRDRLVLDLSRVDRADTKLVASLVVLQRHARVSNVVLAILPSPHVWNWLVLCGVAGMSPFSKGSP